MSDFVPRESLDPCGAVFSRDFGQKYTNEVFSSQLQNLSAACRVEKRMFKQ